MPEVIRVPMRMLCGGIDLVHPVDRMPEGYYPYLQNVRVTSEGRIDARPGYTPFGTLANADFHSIRRLNDQDAIYAPTEYIYVLGSGADLVAGVESALSVIDTGYSGDPLSLLTFRPENSPVSWMYVYDRLRQAKVRPDGAFRPIGLDPPPGPPTEAEYWVPGEYDLHTGQFDAGWTASGVAAAPSTQNRVTVASTIAVILYNSGTSGWACISPDTPNLTWAGERMKVILGGTENCIVREIHPAISATTLLGIDYDSGSTGLATVVLAGSPDGLDRNSLIVVGGEAVRVLSVTMSPDGTTYSARCFFTATHAAGDAVTGLISWYTYMQNTHVAGETITSNYVLSAVASLAGGNLGAIAVFTTLDASKAGNGRPISLADDYLHISFFASNPYGIVTLKLYVDIDAATTGLANAFQGNYLTWTIQPNQINNFDQTTPPAAGCWTELVLPLSEGVRSGTDQTSSLADIHALKIEVTLSDVCDFGFDWWYLLGTYGPTIQPNSPVGIVYATRNRDSETGAASVPGPPTRYELFPLREGIVVTPLAYTGTGFVDSLDIYRQGGDLAELTFVGSLAGPTPVLQFLDEQPDSSLLSSLQADFTLIQPWPVTDVGWSGVVNVVGTTVRRVSGTPFNVNLLSNQVIQINGVSYQTYGQPSSADRLELFKSVQGAGGIGTNVHFELQSPTLAAQPLPFSFGPLEGPFAPVGFALGDPKNAGTLYYTNFGNLDAAPDTNTLEVCPPGEPLISGAVWNGLIIVGSRDNIYLIRYSYLNSVGQSGPATFQSQRLPSPSGMWSRWTCVRAQDGVYFLGRDGFYRANESGVERVASPDPKSDPLYPLFPHDGQPAAGTADLAPVDMTVLPFLRLSCCDQDLYFDYFEVAS
jgi:hypothetical protein